MVFANADHADENSHPFCYAQVLGVYYANVVYIGPGIDGYESHRMEFLWVWRYQQMCMTCSCWMSHRLDRLQFLPVAAEDAFGFVDPSDILRACHVIPAFA